MTSQNGQLVLQTLQNLEQPSTLAKISKKIADAVGLNVSDVKDSIRQTLDGGVQFGYIQQTNKKYFSAPMDLTEMTDALVPSEDDGQNEPEDRVKRSRRRRSSRRRSVSRSTSRKRKRRSTVR